MTLQELYFSLYDKNTPRNPRLFVETFENNYILINNANLKNLVEYEYAMWLLADYAIQLENLGYLKKSIEYFDRALKLYENHPNHAKEKLFEIQHYELLKFHKARALYNLKKYNASLSIFKELDRAFPKNEQYLSWLKGIRYKSIERITWIAFGVMILLFIMNSILKEKSSLTDRVLFWAQFTSLLFFIICLAINAILKIKQKKNNAT